MRKEKRHLKILQSPRGYFVADKDKKMSSYFPTRTEAESQKQYLTSR